MRLWKINFNTVSQIRANADSYQPLAFLRAAVIPSVQNFALNGITALGKNIEHRLIRPPAVVAEQTAHVLEQKSFRTQLVQQNRVVIKQSAARVFKPQPFAGVRKRLARRAARKQIQFAALKPKIFFKVARRNIRNVGVNHIPRGAVEF